MSRILDLGKDNEKLFDLLVEYDEALKGIEDLIAIKGKNLEVANRENAAWAQYYDNKRVELKTLVDHFSLEIKRIRGKLYKSYTENHMVDLNERGKDRYIDTEPAYLQVAGLALEVQELYDKYVVATDAFKTRGYALNNITKAVVAQVQNHII